MTRADEQTPLIQGNGPENSTAGVDGCSDERGRLINGTKSPAAAQQNVPSSSRENRVLLVAALITWAFEINQATQLYVFYMMECDIYYDKHGPWDGQGDRCSRSEIAAGTAAQFSRLCMSTYLFGIINLFLVGRMNRKWGPRATMGIQVLFPMLRISTQLVGIAVGKRAGERIIQASQIFCIIGGPSGYKLSVNTIAGEVVSPSQRTAMFGKLQGVIMASQGLARLTGGYLGNAMGIRAPYLCALVFMALAQPLVHFGLPYISPESLFGTAKAANVNGVAAFLAPLKILAPQTLRVAGGKKIRHYGVAFLSIGIFLGVLATGYSAFLVQLYATHTFGLGQEGLGTLMFEFYSMRGFFLIVVFPRIIKWGRQWFISQSVVSQPKADGSEVAEREDEDLAQPEEPESAIEPGSDQETGFKTFGFDLFFLRWSYLFDGFFMFMAASMERQWHVHLAASILPLASGSAAAAKGTITAMVPESRRADALGAINLIEQVAMLATQGLFGFVFGWFANLGHASWTFYCNGTIALVALSILLMARLPPKNSRVVES